MSDEIMAEDYIGDGVYAEFDGYYIWLRVNDKKNPRVVALEPEVFEALKRFDKRCKDILKERAKK